ncbi:amidase family protein [Streptomyces pinistramenti]|uniref:amidase family protein n=1 Tax=Streptomyces pinistramenti TaxID=2884812 RepID=UPI0027E4CCAB|nr:amidase family protein [Streptomyces pinistramenti]
MAFHLKAATPGTAAHRAAPAAARAAAVAAALVALGTAGDDHGSTRIPAALCGGADLKPSHGHIPQGPSPLPFRPQHTCPG